MRRTIKPLEHPSKQCQLTLLHRPASLQPGGPGVPWHLLLSFRGLPAVKTDALTSFLVKFQAHEKLVAAQHISAAFR